MWNETDDLVVETTSLAAVMLNDSFPNISKFGPQRDSLYVVIPITVIYAIIFLTGVVGNVSTCIVIARNKSMHTATNYYLFSLAVSDLLLLVTGLPQEMYSIWSRYPYVFGEIFCVLRGLASETSANATVLTITAFTVERYVAICHPFLSHTMSKLSRAVKLILAIWVVAFGFAVPQALQFGIVTDETVMCMFKKVIMKHSFEVSTFLFFVAPMTLITVLYALIGLRLRTSNMMKRNSVHQGSRDSNSRRSCRHQQGQSSRRVLKMLVAVVVAFFICWAPFHAQRLVAIYGKSLQAAPPYQLKVYEIVTYVSGVLYYVSTTVNPVLYHIMSNKFREAFKETFSRCCWCRGSVHSGRSGRLSDRRSCYSILSRSGAANGHPRTGTKGRPGAQESTDSGTSITHRHSEESMCLHPTTTPVTTPGRHGSFVRTDTQESTLTDSTTATGKQCYVQANTFDERRTSMLSYQDRESKTSQFLRLFRCTAKETSDDPKLRVESPVVEQQFAYTKPEVKVMFNNTSSYDVSNSSLRDMQNGALEDELTIYMKEIQRREKDSS
ncbi:Pyrokinin 1 receptor [Carabus blaptoides fortunei]